MSPKRGGGRQPIQRGVTCKNNHDAWVEEARGGFACAECHRERSRRSAKKRRKENPAKFLWTKARERARDELQPFLLTVEDIEAAWPTDNVCPVLGIPLVSGEGFTTDNSPTLDRLSHDAGYEPGNVAVISMRANRAKQRLAAWELELVAAWMRSRGLD